MNTDFSSPEYTVSILNQTVGQTSKNPISINYRCLDIAKNADPATSVEFLVVTADDAIMTLSSTRGNIHSEHSGEYHTVTHSLLDTISHYIKENALRPYASPGISGNTGNVSLFKRPIQEAFDFLNLALKQRSNPNGEIVIVDENDPNRVPTRPVIVRLASPKPMMKHTDKEKHKHRRALLKRIRDCEEVSFLIRGDLSYVSNRYGNVVKGEDGADCIILDAKAYRLEESGDHIELYIIPVSCKRQNKELDDVKPN